MFDPISIKNQHIFQHKGEGLVICGCGLLNLISPKCEIGVIWRFSVETWNELKWMLSDDAEKDMVTAVKNYFGCLKKVDKNAERWLLNATDLHATLHCNSGNFLWEFRNSARDGPDQGGHQIPQTSMSILIPCITKPTTARNRNVTNIISCMLWIVTFYGTVSTTRNFWSDTKQNNSLKTLVWRIPEFCTSMIHYGSWSIMDHRDLLNDLDKLVVTDDPLWIMIQNGSYRSIMDHQWSIIETSDKNTRKSWMCRRLRTLEDHNFVVPGS